MIQPGGQRVKDLRIPVQVFMAEKGVNLDFDHLFHCHSIQSLRCDTTLFWPPSFRRRNHYSFQGTHSKAHGVSIRVRKEEPCRSGRRSTGNRASRLPGFLWIRDGNVPDGSSCLAPDPHSRPHVPSRTSPLLDRAWM